MTNMITLGISGMTAYQTALTICGQNITNANSPSYARRQIDLAENASGNVSVADVNRMVNESANQYVRASQSNYQQMNTYLTQLQNLEPLFEDNSTSISKYITDSLTALNTLNGTTSSSQARTLFMGKLQNLSQQFQNISSELNRQNQLANQSITQIISQVSTDLSNIAGINQLIMTSNGQDVTALLDQRDGIVDDLSKYFNFTTQTGTNNVMNISLTNGVQLLTGNPPPQIVPMTDPNNPGNVIIGLQSGNQINSITNMITGGQLAAQINFRNNALNPAQMTLDRLSMTFAGSFNTQNKLGMDQNGNLGADLFTDINSVSAINSRMIANSNNVGTSNMTVSITNTGALQASSYQLTMGAGNTYALRRLTDNSVVSTGTLSGTFPQSIAVDGFSLSINSGTFNSGDQYVITPTTGGCDNFNLSITDPSQIALAWPVYASPGVHNGTGAISVTNVSDTTNTAFSVPNQLNPPIQIQFTSATTFLLVNANTSETMEGPLTYNPDTGITNLFPTPGGYNPGYQVSLQGNIAAGDTFNITYNSNSSGNDNGLALSNLFQQQLCGNGTRTYSQDYNALVGNLASVTNQANSGYESTKVVLQQAEYQRDQISGVSLEEESMNMAEFQEAYQASAQVLQAAKSILDIVSAMVRR